MYSFDSRVRYSEVDENRELTVTAMINYLQDCSTFQSEDLHKGIDYLAERQRAWWLSSWQIIAERYPLLGEEIVISTWPHNFKGMYGYRNFTIQDRVGNYLVKADSVWFLFDTGAERPVRVGEEDIRGYGTLEPRLAMEPAPRRIEIPEEYETAEAVTIMRHHIDTNHHVNNAKYVEIAREALPENIKLRELRIEYKKAAVLGDVMIPHVSRREDGYTISLCSPEGSPYANVWVRVF